MKKTKITILFGTGEFRQFIVRDEIERQIRDGHVIHISTKTPNQGDEMMVICVDKRKTSPNRS